MGSGAFPDLFICYAREDREFAAGMAGSLAELGVKVIYERYALNRGDDLGGLLGKGIVAARYGMLVLSRAFLRHAPPLEAMDWAARLAGGPSPVLLPIADHISPSDVACDAPELAKRLGDAGRQRQLLDGIAPEVPAHYFTAVYARRALLELGREYITHVGEIALITRLSGLRFQREISGEFQQRLVLARACLLDTLPMPEAEWVEKFRCELFLEREIKAWEQIAACITSYRRHTPLSPAQCKTLLGLLLSIHLDNRHPAAMHAALKRLPESCLEFLADFFTSDLPAKLAFIRQIEGVRREAE